VGVNQQYAKNKYPNPFASLWQSFIRKSVVDHTYYLENLVLAIGYCDTISQLINIADDPAGWDKVYTTNQQQQPERCFRLVDQ